MMNIFVLLTAMFFVIVMIGFVQTIVDYVKKEKALTLRNSQKEIKVK